MLKNSSNSRSPRNHLCKIALRCMGLFGDRIESPRIWGTKGEKETKKEKLVAEGGRRKERKKEGRRRLCSSICTCLHYTRLLFLVNPE